MSLHVVLGTAEDFPPLGDDSRLAVLQRKQEVIFFKNFLFFQNKDRLKENIEILEIDKTHQRGLEGPDQT